MVILIGWSSSSPVLFGFRLFWIQSNLGFNDFHPVRAMEPPRVRNVVGLIFRGLRAWNSNEAASLKLPQILSLESGNAFILHGPNFTTYSTITANSNEFGSLHSGRENVWFPARKSKKPRTILCMFGWLFDWCTPLQSFCQVMHAFLKDSIFKICLSGDLGLVLFLGPSWMFCLGT